MDYSYILFILAAVLTAVFCVFAVKSVKALREESKSQKLEDRKPATVEKALTDAATSATQSPQTQTVATQSPQTQTAATQSPFPVLPKPPLKPDQPAPEKTLKQALALTEKNIFGRLQNLFISDQAKNNLESIEEVLYTSDLGPLAVQKLLVAIEDKLSMSDMKDMGKLKKVIKEQFESIFSEAQFLEPDQKNPLGHLKTTNTNAPVVWMVVGVNGAGKTTTIGKLSSHLAGQGKKVLIAAGDTFRAAADAQLRVWSERAQVEIFSPENVKDPSAVAFEAIQVAKNKKFDIVIIDTAGRLHTQTNLMEELKKMKRVMEKAHPGSPDETLIVLDANSGQNALQQAKEFNLALNLTGVILTKMDGSAKGGVAIGLANDLKLPIRLIGIGEKLNDLKPFSSKDFIDSLF